MPAPKQRPLADEDPTRSPVYEPGPALRQTASQSVTLSPRSSSISLTNTAVLEACSRGSELWRYDVTLSPSSNAVEHNEVDVSMSMILGIAFGDQSFNVREKSVPEILQVPVNGGFVKEIPACYVELVVEFFEETHEQCKQKRGLEYAENYAQQPVEPPEGCEFDQAGQKPAEESAQQECDEEYCGEADDADDLGIDLVEVRGEPLSCGQAESACQPHADEQSGYAYELLYQPLADALPYGGDETQKQYDIQSGQGDLLIRYGFAIFVGIQN